MHKQVIAFDCDDVLVSIGALLVQHYNMLHATNVRPEDFYSKDYKNVWKADPETAVRDVMQYLFTDDYMDLAPMAGAKETLAELSKQYRLFIVTGRPDATRRVTERWLESHLPNVFEEVIFTNFFKLSDSKDQLRSKADVCKELGATYLVDDHVHHIHTVSEQGITGLLFGDLPWEQPDILPANAVKIKDWEALASYFLTESELVTV